MIGRREGDDLNPDDLDLEGGYSFKKKLKVESGKQQEDEGLSEDQTLERVVQPLLEPYDPKKYNFIKEIGHGTFGVVWKAKNLETNSVVAIKKTAQDPRNTNREFMILSKLDHPNCLKLIGYFFTKEPQSAGPKVPTKLDDEDQNQLLTKKRGPDDEEPLVDFLNLVTHYYGENLYSIMDFYRKLQKSSSGPKKGLPHPLVKLYSYQILRALNYLQKKKIVHRDLKPSNILIDTKS